MSKTDLRGRSSPFKFESPDDIALSLGERVRALRVAPDLRQSDLAERAGVDLKALRRFERTGTAALSTVVRVAFALGVQEQFDALFETPPTSLDDLIDDAPVRQRVRLRR